MNRKQAREQAFILIFENSFQPDCPSEDIINLYNEAAELSSGEDELMVEVDSFASKLMKGVSENLESIDSIISKYAIGWNLSRIPKVTLSILRMAIYEMDFVEDIPVGVSINEAVEIAKKYSTKEDSAFINGILGKYSREKE